MGHRLLSLILLATLIAGCAGQPTRTASQSAADAYAGFDLATFEGFAGAIEKSMGTQDASLLVERFDARQFTLRALSSLGEAAVKKETVDAYDEFMGEALEERLASTFSDVRTGKFLRLKSNNINRGNTSIALFRVETEGGNTNYWQAYLRRTNGRIAVIDWYSLSLGDLASRSIGQYVLVAGLAIADPEYKYGEVVSAYINAVRRDDTNALLSTYEHLPEALQNNAMLMLSRVHAAAEISDTRYSEVLAELAPRYRDNDIYALSLINHYLTRGEYEAVHNALDIVAERIGEDAGLDNMHARVALKTKSYPRAIAHARDGIAREAAYEENYWTLLEALVHAEHYADAVLVLDILTQGFGYLIDADKFAALDGYEAFSQSQAFADWASASGAVGE